MRKSIPNSGSGRLRRWKRELPGKITTRCSAGISGSGSIFSPLPIPRAVPPFRKKGTSEPSLAAIGNEVLSREARRFQKRRKPKQRCGGIAASSAQAGSGRNRFSQGYGCAQLCVSDLRPARSGSFPDQVFFLRHVREGFRNRSSRVGEGRNSSSSHRSIVWNTVWIS